MNAFRTSWFRLLGLAGLIALVLVALPLMAAVAFMLRAAFLVAIPAAIIVVGALWLASARFRGWFRSATSVVETYKGLRLATDVAVDPGHAWARPQGTAVTVGADDLLVTVLGPVDRVDLPPQGQRVRRGDVLFRLRRGIRALDVRAPVAGTVIAANQALAREPALVNADPFRRGWAVRLRRVAGSGRDLRNLRRGADAVAWFRSEVDRMLTTVLGRVAAAPVMADGGLVMGDFHERVDEDAWRELTAALGGTRS